MRLRSKKETPDKRSAEEKQELAIRYIDAYIGSGVFPKVDLDKGALVAFYQGELITGEEGRERFYTLPENKGSFLFFFHHQGREFCVDATLSTGCGRMLNDDRKPNCKVVVEEQDDVLRLAIYTLKKVSKGTELRHNYGDSTAFWRRFDCSKIQIEDICFEWIWNISHREVFYNLNIVTNEDVVEMTSPSAVLTDQTDIERNIASKTVRVRHCHVELNNLAIEMKHIQLEKNKYMQVNTEDIRQAEVEITSPFTVLVNEQIDREKNIDANPVEVYQGDEELNSQATVMKHNQPNGENIKVNTEDMRQAEVEMTSPFTVLVNDQIDREKNIDANPVEDCKGDEELNNQATVIKHNQSDGEKHVQENTDDIRQAEVEITSPFTVLVNDQIDREKNIDANPVEDCKGDEELNNQATVIKHNQSDGEKHVQENTDDIRQAEVEITSPFTVLVNDQIDREKNIDANPMEVCKGDEELNNQATVMKHNQSDGEKHVKENTEDSRLAEVEITSPFTELVNGQIDREKNIDANPVEFCQGDEELNSQATVVKHNQSDGEKHIQENTDDIRQAEVEITSPCTVLVNDQIDREKNIDANPVEVCKGDEELNNQATVMKHNQSDGEKHVQENTEDSRLAEVEITSPFTELVNDQIDREKNIDANPVEFCQGDEELNSQATVMKHNQSDGEKHVQENTDDIRQAEVEITSPFTVLVNDQIDREKNIDANPVEVCKGDEELNNQATVMKHNQSDGEKHVQENTEDSRLAEVEITSPFTELVNDQIDREKNIDANPVEFCQGDEELNSQATVMKHNQSDGEKHVQENTDDIRQAEVEITSPFTVLVNDQIDREKNIDANPVEVCQGDEELNNQATVMKHNQSDGEKHVQVNTEDIRQAEVEMASLFTELLIGQNDREKNIDANSVEVWQGDEHLNSQATVMKHNKPNGENIQVNTEESRQAEVEITSPLTVLVNDQIDREKNIDANPVEVCQGDEELKEKHVQVNTENMRQAEVEMTSPFTVPVNEQIDKEKNIDANPVEVCQGDVELNSQATVMKHNQPNGENIKVNTEDIRQAEVEMTSPLTVLVIDQNDREKNIDANPVEGYQGGEAFKSQATVMKHNPSDGEKHQVNTEDIMQAEVEITSPFTVLVNDQIDREKNIDANPMEVYQGDEEFKSQATVMKHNPSDGEKHQVNTEDIRQAEVEITNPFPVLLNDQIDREKNIDAYQVKVCQGDEELNSQATVMKHNQSDVEKHVQVNTDDIRQAEVEMISPFTVLVIDQIDREKNIDANPVEVCKGDEELNSQATVMKYNQSDGEKHIQGITEHVWQTEIEMTSPSALLLNEDQTVKEKNTNANSLKVCQNDVKLNSQATIMKQKQLDGEKHIQVNTKEDLQTEVGMTSPSTAYVNEEVFGDDVKLNSQAIVMKHNQLGEDKYMLDENNHIQGKAKDFFQADVIINTMSSLLNHYKSEKVKHNQVNKEKQADLLVNSLTAILKHYKPRAEKNNQVNAEKHCQAVAEMNTPAVNHYEPDEEKRVQASTDKNCLTDIEMTSESCTPVYDCTDVEKQAHQNINYQTDVEMIAEPLYVKVNIEEENMHSDTRVGGFDYITDELSSEYDGSLADPDFVFKSTENSITSKKENPLISRKRKPQNDGHYPKKRQLIRYKRTNLEDISKSKDSCISTIVAEKQASVVVNSLTNIMKDYKPRGEYNKPVDREKHCQAVVEMNSPTVLLKRYKLDDKHVQINAGKYCQADVSLNTPAVNHYEPDEEKRVQASTNKNCLTDVEMTSESCTPVYDCTDVEKQAHQNINYQTDVEMIAEPLYVKVNIEEENMHSDTRVECFDYITDELSKEFDGSLNDSDFVFKTIENCLTSEEEESKEEESLLTRKRKLQNDGHCPKKRQLTRYKRTNFGDISKSKDSSISTIDTEKQAGVVVNSLTNIMKDYKPREEYNKPIDREKHCQAVVEMNSPTVLLKRYKLDDKHVQINAGIYCQADVSLNTLAVNHYEPGEEKRVQASTNKNCLTDIEMTSESCTPVYDCTDVEKQAHQNINYQTDVEMIAEPLYDKVNIEEENMHSDTRVGGFDNITDELSSEYDDSRADPDFVFKDTDTSEEEESVEEESEEEESLLTCKRKPQNVGHFPKIGQLTRYKRTNLEDIIYESEDSCSSTVIPYVSGLFSQSHKVSVKNNTGDTSQSIIPIESQSDSTNQNKILHENHSDSTRESLPFSSKQSSLDTKKCGTSTFGLQPKQPKKDGCNQVYDKVNYCTFCKKDIRSKISRHLLSKKHQLEPRVYEILLLPKRSEARMVKLEILANEGNFKHNIEVLKEKVGFLVVGRRQNTVKDFKVGRYLPCDFCKKFILRRTLYLHHRNCTVQRYIFKTSGKSNDEFKANAVQLSRQLLNSALMDEVDPGVSILLSRMNHDDVTEEVEKDDLIRRYAALKVESLGRPEDQKINDIHRVSQSCRTLARLIIKCRENTECRLDLNQLISTKNFDLVVSSTKSMCMNNGKSAPSLGKLIGNNLSHIIQVKKGAALREDDSQKLEEAENFQRLFTLEWNYRVNSVCQKMANTINRQKVKTIPLTEDLQKLRHYILSSMENASACLQKTKYPEIWTRLAKLTLCRLILFNKRRRAEVKDLKLNEFIARPNWQEEQSGEFKMALSTSDKLLAERMDMVISAGKSKKNVDAYVIMPPDAKKAVELLNLTRHQVGIPRSNPFMFARVNCDSPLSGNTDLREIVEQCPGLQHPERITSTGLRRYIATVTQILDMSDSELESLARHLGHDSQTHKQNYRLSHATRELTVVSQLLIAVDNGLVNKWKNKRLADISVDELPDVEQLCEEDWNEDDGDNGEGCTSDLTHCDSSAGMEQYVPSLPPEDAFETPKGCTSDLTHCDSSAGMEQYVPSLPPEDAFETPKGCTSDLTHSDSSAGNEQYVQSPPPEVALELPKGKRGKKEKWTKSAETFLRRFFKFYLNGKKTSIHNADMIMAQNTCSELSSRSLAQIRTKLNNMKLGKSK